MFSIATIKRFLLSSFAVFFFQIAISGISAFAATYYVDTNSSSAADDGSHGSESLPWKTLQYAADNVEAGDMVLVKDGNYVGFQISTSGTGSEPITFKSVNKLGAVITQRNPITAHGINVEGGDYVVIDGFKVVSMPSRGIRVVTARGVVVKNCEISGSAVQNILTGYAPEIKIINNISYGALLEHGIYVSNGVEGDDYPVIRGNVVYNNNTNGIQINADCYSQDSPNDGIISKAIIEDNIVFGNNAKGLSLISMQDSIVQNNVIYDNGGAGGIHLTDEPGCGDPSDNNIVVNNTIVENDTYGIQITDEATGNIIFNNIAIASALFRTIMEDGASGNHIDSSSNLKYAYPSGLDLFVNPINTIDADFSLKDTATAAIDKGIAGYQGEDAPTSDIVGAQRPWEDGYDIGAYESGDPPIVNPPDDDSDTNQSVSGGCMLKYGSANSYLGLFLLLIVSGFGFLKRVYD